METVKTLCRLNLFGDATDGSGRRNLLFLEQNNRLIVKQLFKNEFKKRKQTLLESLNKKFASADYPIVIEFVSLNMGIHSFTRPSLICRLKSGKNGFNPFISSEMINDSFNKVFNNIIVNIDNLHYQLVIQTTTKLCCY